MRLGAGGWLLAGCVVLMAQSALGANLSAALKNYYAEYEVVIQCEEQSQLSEADADKAEDAIDMIETHYLDRDSSIDTDRLIKAAVKDKDEGFRITARSGKSALRPYCRMSLRELLVKAKEISPSGAEQ